ncbi:hypothetical protein QJQ45_010874 [Haematococcus lacustris]|nr:hypothetical protein QJQ45_010874 [Haematococcus lacustris]
MLCLGADVDKGQVALCQAPSQAPSQASKAPLDVQRLHRSHECTYKHSKACIRLGAEQVGSSNSKAGDSEVAPQAVETLSFKRPPPGPLAPEDLHLWATFSVSQLFHTRTHNDREAILLEMDVDGNGQLDWVELRGALERVGLPCTPEYYVHKREHSIEQAFRSFDLDGDGTISRTELHRVLASAGIPISHADRHTQEGEGGAISFNEFRRLAAFLPTTSQGLSTSQLSFTYLTLLAITFKLYVPHSDHAVQASYVEHEFIRTSLAVSLGIICLSVLDSL